MRKGWPFQTMRSGAYLQPGQTYSCIGCHEHRGTAPPNQAPLAARRAPSKLSPGPPGSWPLDYGTLVQPVLDRQCVVCHKLEPGEKKMDLTPAQSYAVLTTFGSPSLKEVVIAGTVSSVRRQEPARRGTNPVLKLLKGGHHGVKTLGPTTGAGCFTWMDTQGQRAGHFSPAQEEQLRAIAAADGGHAGGGALRSTGEIPS